MDAWWYNIHLCKAINVCIWIKNIFKRAVDKEIHLKAFLRNCGQILRL